MKNKIIENFLREKSTLKLRQVFKLMKQALIEQQWMFDKIQKQKEAIVYKERSYNRSIIQSAFFFEICLAIGTGNDVKQMEPLRDTTERRRNGWGEEEWEETYTCVWTCV